MREDDFMVTSSNQQAANWIKAFPAWPSHVFVLYGPKGSGKTHLAHIWLSRNNGAMIALDDLIAKDHVTLAQTTKHLAFDDAEAVAGNKTAEEALFYLHNHLREVSGALLLTGERPPGEWGIKLPDLLSRLRTATASPIHAPDDDLLMALFVKQISDRQLDVSQDVIKYLISRVERSPQAVATIIDRLDRASIAKHAKISIALARDVMAKEI